LITDKTCLKGMNHVWRKYKEYAKECSLLIKPKGDTGGKWNTEVNTIMNNLQGENLVLSPLFVTHVGQTPNPWERILIRPGIDKTNSRRNLKLYELCG